MVEGVVQVEQYFRGELTVRTRTALGQTVVRSVITFSGGASTVLRDTVVIGVTLTSGREVLSDNVLGAFLILVCEALYLAPFVPTFH